MTDRSRNQSELTRRRLLTGMAIGGAAVAGGAVGGVATATASDSVGFRRGTLTLDVACLADKFRFANSANPGGNDDFRSSFSVEGWIYPAGTIPGDGFVPTLDQAIGHWFCRGWMMVDGDRSEPHAMSVQDFVIGVITPDRLLPTDNLSSSGIEGTFGQQIGTRAVVGGTGTYKAAAGQVTQTNNGINTTVFVDGSGDPGPNFVFDFELLIPKV
ncbi:MAG: hypothetical protein U9N84_09680 [Actinomycetota bacterium]|nr:hypothetical protein [Actinomycetota bacterium]